MLFVRLCMFVVGIVGRLLGLVRGLLLVCRRFLFLRCLRVVCCLCLLLFFVLLFVCRVCIGLGVVGICCRRL